MANDDEPLRWAYQQHATSGELYAFQYKGDDLIGVAGPLDEDDAIPENVLDFEYEEDDVEWANEQDWQPVNDIRSVHPEEP